jgi:ribosome biogenesis protein BRX1
LEELDLVEIGPRFSLSPIKIFDGFMGGEVIYSNKFYVPPRQLKKDMQVYQAKRFLDKLASKKRKGFNKKFAQPRDELDQVFDEIEKYEKGEIDNFEGKPGAEFDDGDDN